MQIQPPNFDAVRYIISEIIQFSTATELETMELAGAKLRKIINDLPSRPGHFMRRRRLTFAFNKDETFTLIVKDFLGRSKKLGMPLRYNRATDTFTISARPRAKSFWYLLHRCIFTEVVFNFGRHNQIFTRQNKRDLRNTHWQLAHVINRHLRRRIHCNRLVFVPPQLFPKGYQNRIRRFFKFYPIPLSA